MNSLIWGYLWCALSALASALASYLIKMSSANSEGGLAMFRSHTCIALLGSAVLAYGVGFVCYTLALHKLQMSVAYPVMTAITMFIVTTAGYIAFHETITLLKVCGIAAIAMGVFMLSLPLGN